MASVPTVTLNNGVIIPIIGTGSYAPNTDEARANAKVWLANAVKNGFRHIDTAMMYSTEGVVGEVIRESGIPRGEFFVTTKLPWSHHGRVKESFDESLNNLGLDYIDLYLMHWPQAIVYEKGNWMPKNADGTLKLDDNVTFNDSWAAIEKLLATGKTRAIGVSNFSIKTFEKLFTTANIIPAVNQVELHPYLAQNELVKYCKEKGIALTAYTPSGYSTVRSDPVLAEIAKKYNVTPNQVTLAWHISRGTIIVPKSADSDRQKENITLVTLSPEDVTKIDALDRNQRICNKADVNNRVYGWAIEQLGW